MLRFGSTAYTDSRVGFSHDRVSRVVKAHLDEALATSVLSSFDAELIYGPTIMGEEFIARYPARFVMDRKARRYSCGPQLDHAAFVAGSWEAKIREYLRGLDSAPDAVAELGATEEQVEALRRILAAAPDAVLARNPVEPEPTPTEMAAVRQQQIMDETRARLPGASGTAFQDAAAAAMANLPPEIREMLARRKPPEDFPASRAPRFDDARHGDSAAVPNPAPPARIAIEPDDGHAEFVGRTEDGRQFFLTTPFEPASGSGVSDGNEFVALYLFDADGALIEATIDALGPRAAMDMASRRTLMDERLRALGEVSIERIEVAPFAVERFGTTFGLIPREPDFEAVEMMPGNYMCFFPPWDSGEYDT